MTATIHELKTPAKAPAQTDKRFPGEIIMTPGLKTLREKVECELHGQRQLAAKMMIHGVEIGRLICEYAETPEVKKVVSEINKEKRDLKVGGRDKAEHCYVAEQLVGSGVNMSKHWLEQCARAFRRLQEKGAPLNVSVRASLQKDLPNNIKTTDVDAKIVEQYSEVPIESTIQSPEKMWPGETEQPGEKPKKSFKDLIVGFVTGLDKIEASIGEVSIRNKAKQEQLADAITAWFEARGAKIDITFN